MRRVTRALLAICAVGVGAAAFIYITLPDVRPLRTSNPESTAFIELRAREAHARGEQPKRIQRWIDYSRISPNLKRAVLVTEDSRFWTHEGIDFDELKESMEVNIERMEFARGGSTITQQLAKNLYLSPSKDPIRPVRSSRRPLQARKTRQFPSCRRRRPLPTSFPGSRRRPPAVRVENHPADRENPCKFFHLGH